jgi:hypothetical protein
MPKHARKNVTETVTAEIQSAHLAWAWRHRAYWLKQFEQAQTRVGRSAARSQVSTIEQLIVSIEARAAGMKAPFGG